MGINRVAMVWRVALSALLGLACSRSDPAVRDAASAPAAPETGVDDGALAGDVPEAGLPVPAGPAPTCAEGTFKAQRVPLDLLLLVNASGSMRQTRLPSVLSRWDQVRKALGTFLADPRSAGLGIGVSFFPAPDFPCTVDADCGAAFPGASIPAEACAPALFSGLCVDPRGRVQIGSCTTWIASDQEGCFPPDHCVQAGRCALDENPCLDIGRRCPGGDATNVCQPAPRFCADRSTGRCFDAPYRVPALAMTALPAAAPAVMKAFEARTPAGLSPIDKAVVGSLEYLRRHLAAHPGHRALLVVVSDGGNASSCGVFPDVAKNVAAATQETPPIPTYVIGFSIGPQILIYIARAGGSPQFLINPDGELASEFTTALDDLRGPGLPCEYAVPAPGAGQALDLAKGSVTVAGAAGSRRIEYVASEAGCDPTRGGWHYDVDPATGGSPTRIQICPTSCGELRAELDAEVQLRVACRP